jgi:hypothetical protein
VRFALDGALAGDDGDSDPFTQVERDRHFPHDEVPEHLIPGVEAVPTLGGEALGRHVGALSKEHAIRVAMNPRGQAAVLCAIPANFAHRGRLARPGAHSSRLRSIHAVFS